MPTLTLPTAPAFRARAWKPQAAVGVSRSPYSGVTRTFDFDGRWWVFTVRLPAMQADQARDWEGFFLDLNQTERTFFFGDPAKTVARGVATGTPLVNGAGQTGQSLVTDGWSNSVTNILRRGDHVAIENSLYEITADVNSNGSGQATLSVWPALRGPHADNAAIDVTAPQGIFRLLKPVESEVAEALIWDGLEFDVVEDVQ